MEVSRWALGCIAWGLLAGTAVARTPEIFSVDVFDEQSQFEGSLTLLPPSEGIFDRIPLRAIPGIAPLLLATGVRFFAEELQSQRHYQSAELRYGTESARVDVPDRDLAFLRLLPTQTHWLVPRLQERVPGRHYYEGPLELLPAQGFRFHRRPDQDSGGQLEVRFESPAQWVPASELELPSSISDYRAAPLLFISVGGTWKQSEPVELVDLVGNDAVVVPRRQIERAVPGDEIDLHRYSKHLLEFQTPGLWWLRPEHPLPGRKIGTYLVRHARRPFDVLQEVRRSQAGVLAPPTPTAWTRCSQRIVAAKDTLIDELSLYFARY